MDGLEPRREHVLAAELFLLFDFFGLLDYALAAIEAIGRDAMTQVSLT
jgi:hypothetical protein